MVLFFRDKLLNLTFAVLWEVVFISSFFRLCICELKVRDSLFHKNSLDGGLNHRFFREYLIGSFKEFLLETTESKSFIRIFFPPLTEQKSCNFKE